jgi:hypothetical protein
LRLRATRPCTPRICGYRRLGAWFAGRAGGQAEGMVVGVRSGWASRTGGVRFCVCAQRGHAPRGSADVDASARGLRAGLVGGRRGWCGCPIWLGAAGGGRRFCDCAQRGHAPRGSADADASARGLRAGLAGRRRWIGWRNARRADVLGSGERHPMQRGTVGAVGCCVFLIQSLRRHPHPRRCASRPLPQAGEV